MPLAVHMIRSMVAYCAWAIVIMVMRATISSMTDPKTRFARAQLSAQWTNRRRTCFGRPNREVDVIISYMCRKAAAANPRYMANI